MIQVQLADGRDRDAWSKALAECAGGPLHLPGVQRVDHDEDQLQLLRYVRSGELVACGLAIVIEHRRARGLLRGPRSLHLPSAPAIAVPAYAPEVRAALFDHARAQRCERVEVQASGSEWLVGDDDLERFRTETITEFVLDLGAGPDAVESAMHRQHRKNIRRAERAGLVVEQEDSLQGLLELRQMQLVSSERASERSGGFGVRDEQAFERMHRHVYASGDGHVLFARIEDRRVAALAWIETADQAQTVRSGSSPEGYQLRAMYLLYDALIRRCVGTGRRILNAGGVPAAAARPDHGQFGLYEFKSGFGGRPVDRHALDIELAEVRR
jgi:hypothetical protein